MHRKINNSWVEYRNTIDLNHGRPSNMEIALNDEIKKKPTTSGHTTFSNHLKIDLESIIELIAMPYIVDLNNYELHPRDEKNFNNFIDEC